MPTIKLRLNSQSIAAAMDAVEAYRKKVAELAEALVKRLVEDGVEIARFNVTDMSAIDSGELFNSIHGEFKDQVGFVVADAGHAAFVEFGTGVVGARNTHPDVAIAGWRYDVNEHGELGWWYPGKDGKFHWTKGMPSRPYMYNAAKWLEQIYADEASTLLKGDG